MTASLLLNLYTVLLLKIYYQIRKLDILIKHTIISRNIAFERVKWLKRRYLKAIQFFGSSQEVDCLNSLVSHFFFLEKKKKNAFSVFAYFKNPKDAICLLYHLFKQESSECESIFWISHNTTHKIRPGWNYQSMRKLL